MDIRRRSAPLCGIRRAEPYAGRARRTGFAPVDPEFLIALSRKDEQ
jgi:hypothetical protein